MTKKELLECLPHGHMRKAHEVQSKTFILGSIRLWCGADDTTRSDIMAFFESDGPVKVEVSRRLYKLGLLKAS